MPEILSLGRSSGTLIWAYLQSENQTAKYGESARLFAEMSDLRTYAAVQDKRLAEELEFRIGETTVIEENYSGSAISPQGSLSVSYQERRTPHYRKDQVAQTPWHKVFIVYRDRPVILADLCPYWRIQPWRSQQPRPNPIEGWPPDDEPALYTLDYEAD